jgi:hypothetical protein
MFSFSSHEKAIFHILGAKNGGFCEANTKLKFHISTKPFKKNTRPPYMENLPASASETFPSIPHEKGKFLPNR